MKNTRKLIVLVITFLALAASAHAQSPREQLNQMVEQLQKTPGDNTLREKIIKLAPTLKPAPALPDTAVAFEGRAQFAFKSAKSESDYLAAAQEYEKAVAVAPWVPGYYADLCTIYEKAGRFEDAKRHCGFYLSALTDPAQMTDVKRRIAGLGFGIEKANSPEARAASQKQRDEELVRSLNGMRFDCPESDGKSSNTEERYERWLVIKGSQLTGWMKVIQADPDLARARPQSYSLGTVRFWVDVPIMGAVARHEGPNWEGTYRIASDRIVVDSKMNGRAAPSYTCSRH